jgi:maleylacetate reductase
VRKNIKGSEKHADRGQLSIPSIFTRANPQPIREPGDVVKILKLAA